MEVTEQFAFSAFFYIENPNPHFDYEDLQPGAQVTFSLPRIHCFLDGQLGFRIDNPTLVRG